MSDCEHGNHFVCDDCAQRDYERAIATAAELARLRNELASARRLIALADAFDHEHASRCRQWGRTPDDPCDCGCDEYTAALEAHLASYPVVGV